MENTYKPEIIEAYKALLGNTSEKYIKELLSRNDSDKSKLVKATIQGFVPEKTQNKLKKLGVM